MLRRAGRIVAAATAAWFLIVVATQYVRAVQHNVELSRQLAQTRSEISALSAKRDQDERDITRLSDPRGAIPEIHDRLKLVGPHEAIVYLKSPAPR
jgi:cell division protein FtsB